MLKSYFLKQAKQINFLKLSALRFSTKNTKDYYAILEITKNATEDEIKNSYRSLGIYFYINKSKKISSGCKLIFN